MKEEMRDHLSDLGHHIMVEWTEPYVGGSRAKVIALGYALGAGLNCLVGRGRDREAGSWHGPHMWQPNRHQPLSPSSRTMELAIIPEGRNSRAQG